MAGAVLTTPVFIPGAIAAQAAAYLTEQKQRTPVLMLTARGTVQDRVRGAGYVLRAPETA